VAHKPAFRRGSMSPIDYLKKSARGFSGISEIIAAEGARGSPKKEDPISRRQVSRLMWRRAHSPLD
jgi:hypothetical protein